MVRAVAGGPVRVLALALAASLAVAVVPAVPSGARAVSWPLDPRNSGGLAATSVDQPGGEALTARPAAAPLAGRTVVLDPGHQLGNPHFPREINRPVPAGGFTKPCNTTGASTRGGYPEATFAWRVSRRVRARLVELGARVVMTRTSNRRDRWGPCVDARGRAGNRVGADLKVSVHADASYVARARGFHVIAPADRAPWTDDIHRPSLRLARVLRADLLAAGFPVAGYVAGGDGLDVRSDLGTLNLSDVPTVMVELGNMRGSDARSMTTTRGRARYARALVAGIRSFLG